MANYTKQDIYSFSRRGRCRIYQTSICRQFWSIEKYRDDGESVWTRILENRVRI